MQLAALIQAIGVCLVAGVQRGVDQEESED